MVAIRSAITHRPRRCCADVERNVQAAALLAYLLQGHNPRESWFILKRTVSANNTLDVIRGQKALRPLTSNFVDGIDEEDSPFSRPRLPHSADDNASFHGRVVEEVWSEAKNTLNHVHGSLR